MRARALISRNIKEMVRDPFSIIFGFVLPIVLLLIMNLINKSVSGGVDLFKLEVLTPGMAMFSFSFIVLFSGMLLVKDRTSSFLLRLFASPLKASDYIFGYTIPILPIALVQAIFCYLVAFLLGLKFSMNVLGSLLFMIPIAFLFIAIGLFIGVIVNSDKSVGGVNSVIIQVSSLTCGLWIPLDVVGGAYKEICYLLPFAHALDCAKLAINGEYGGIWSHLIWVIVYTIVFFILAVIIFKRKMKQ